MKTLVAILALVASTAAYGDTTRPLELKGVTLGDSLEKGSNFGPCSVLRGGMCVGTTSFGLDSNARFMVKYVGGQVSFINVNFNPRYSAEVLAGLTAKFGDSTPSGCKPGVQGCHEWKSGGLKLLLIEDIGAVTLTRSTEGNF